jgi:uncharacterized phage protein (TIGR02220 family)
VTTQKQELQEKAVSILETLSDIKSEMTGRKRTFKANKHNLVNIKARLREDATYEECIHVLKIKSKDPFFIDNPQHYNPQTLFRPSNFYKYVEQREDDFQKQNKSIKPENTRTDFGY